MKYTLVKPDGSLSQTIEATTAPSLSPNKGRWLPSEPPEFDPVTHYVEPVVPVPAGAEAVGYVVSPHVVPVPTVVSMRQARLALLGAGMLASVDSAVAGMTGTAGEAARIEWEYATSVDRGSPLVQGLAVALNLDDAALDALFTAAHVI